MINILNFSREMF